MALSQVVQQLTRAKGHVYQQEWVFLISSPRASRSEVSHAVWVAYRVGTLTSACLGGFEVEINPYKSSCVYFVAAGNARVEFFFMPPCNGLSPHGIAQLPTGQLSARMSAHVAVASIRIGAVFGAKARSASADTDLLGKCPNATSLFRDLYQCVIAQLKCIEFLHCQC